MITKSCGNVFLDLGFPPDEAEILAMRSNLMIQLTAKAAKLLGVKQSRVSDLVRGKFERFSLDMLISFAIRAGMHVELRLAA
ncbi:MAG: XRE family transcriptional regulator [Magnetococcus sp. YQC-9]